MRPVNIDLDPETESCAEIRAEVEALKAIRARNARRPSPRVAGSAAPAPAVGPGGQPVEQIIIAQEFATGRVRRLQMGIAAWLIPSIVAFGTDAQKQRFLPPTFRGRDDLVPAVLRAGS